MAEAIVHLLVPLVVMRVVAYFYDMDKKLILMLSTFAIFPDIDFFVFWHRATFHNLFFGALLIVVAILLLKKYYGKAKIIVIGALFFLSHSILDKFTIAWFYPMQQFHYNLLTGAKISLQTMNDLKPDFSLQYKLTEIFVVLIIYLILIYEAYFYKKNAKKT